MPNILDKQYRRIDPMMNTRSKILAIDLNIVDFHAMSERWGAEYAQKKNLEKIVSNFEVFRLKVTTGRTAMY
ncbi:hypothetical protein PT2222_10450 [Paraburkholderia tropica]